MTATPTGAPSEWRKGLLAGFGAYLIWGLLPLYLRQLHGVPAADVLAHRIVWSVLVMALVTTATRGWPRLRAAFGRPRLLAMLLASAIFITCNWLIYTWAVLNGHVLDTSLGYFINPLISVVFGVALLGERLSRPQWLAVGAAATGVAVLAIGHGALPLISLGLAFSFAIYGLIRKQVAVDAVPGLAIESVYLLLPAIGWLLWQASQNNLHLGYDGVHIDLLLILGGGLTALPLIGFAYGARRIPFTLVGLLQYIAPTLQLLIGVWIFSEPFDRNQLIGFAGIWTALAIYALDGVYRSRRNRTPVLPAAVAEAATCTEQETIAPER